MKNNIKTAIQIIIASFLAINVICIGISETAFAESVSSEITDDIDVQITDLEKNLEQLNRKKLLQQINQASLNKEKLNNIESSIKNITQTLEKQDKYDAKRAVESLAGQINEIKKQFEQQQEINAAILEEIKKLQEVKKTQNDIIKTAAAHNSDDHYYDSNKYLYNEYTDNPRAAGVNTAMYLVNPAPANNVNYTQDAINSQGNSTMVFQYAPNQLYKVYCRVGYLTDVALKEGENITFVGGGDTASWMLETSTVGKTPHLYIKPVTNNVNTNIVVNTTEHTYQLILNSSDWYNPMVRWNYGIENNINMQQQKKLDEKIIIGDTNAYSVDRLNFNYSIKGEQSWKPVMVFDDGQKTFIKFKQLKSTMPVLFIKEKGKKTVSMVNYKIKDDCYIVDKIFEEAQLRLNETDIVKIIAD